MRLLCNFLCNNYIIRSRFLSSIARSLSNCLIYLNVSAKKLCLYIACFPPKEKVRSVPQMVVIWEQDEPVYVGSNLELFCTVLSKDLKTRYRWYYRDSDVPVDSKLGTLINQSLYEVKPIPNDNSWSKWKLKLQLKNVSVADSGLYGCQAENVVGNNSRQTYLNVTVRPITPSATGM